MNNPLPLLLQAVQLGLWQPPTKYLIVLIPPATHIITRVRALHTFKPTKLRAWAIFDRMMEEVWQDTTSILEVCILLALFNFSEKFDPIVFEETSLHAHMLFLSLITPE
ncbi:hypothetical protein M378DRAFT_13328 [Amanita muscaria Koide BX008]|uniref:Uncharacterized protein n=1 Tax=Amanita muscaria (strain Koide BX008) TaxID=946122 RepID=A0A0C2T5C0_AMAMK|nr:hypothetical protein M378DRAFT_13328 [Amanita muscaria Koide BX008]